MHAKHYLALLALLLVLPRTGHATRPLAPEDWYQFQALSDLALAPDGKDAAYLVTRYERDADDSRSELWLASWSGSAGVQLTHGQSVSEPRFTPDGRSLSFLSARPEGSPAQLWMVPRRGGSARQVSHVSGEISSYEWSPDGTHVALVMHGTYACAHADAHKRHATPQPFVIDGMLFKVEGRGYLDAVARQHLYLLDVRSGGCVPLARDELHEQVHPVFAADGRTLAYVQRSLHEPQEMARDEIYLTEPRADASARRLTSVWSPNHQRLAWSADGRKLALLVGEEARYNSYISDRLALIDVASGELRSLTDALDRGIYYPNFIEDGAALAFTVEDDGYQYPARVRLADGTIERLGGPMVVSQLVSAGGHTAVLVSSDRNPPEVYALEDGALRPLSAHNRALFAQLQLSDVEDIRFKSRDGTEVHGQLLKPPGFQPGHRYPTILWIHGGPQGQDDHSLELTSYGPPLERQFFAGHGYVVLAVNYRGSTTRGQQFAHAIAADWGHLEVEDVLAAVDYAIAQGIADPEHLGIGGWSYGALLTDYTIAGDGRFKAAIAGAGSGNQTAMYGTDEYIISNNAEVGTPWQAQERWLRLSYPFFHADRIHTPTLFVGGDKDFDVPIAGGEQMYQALRVVGVPTQLIVYPDETHSISRPRFLVDRWQRYLEWMDRYLK